MIRRNVHVILFGVLNGIVLVHIQMQPFWLPQESAFRFHNNAPIRLRPEAFDDLIDRWQIKLQNSWKKFYNQLEADIGMKQKDLEILLANQSLSNMYSNLKEIDWLKHNEYKAEDANPEIVDFIKRTVQKYCTKKNIKIILSSHINTITATFGSDQTTHYLICHAKVYTPENIAYYYEYLANNNGAFYVEKMENNRYRCIELSNFLILGIIEAASHIQHQSNLLSFFVSNLKKADQRAQLSTIQLGHYIVEIRGMLEAVFQSKNPLEAALFIGKSKMKDEKERKLWKKLVQEIASCYTQESLHFFKESQQDIIDFYIEQIK